MKMGCKYCECRERFENKFGFKYKTEILFNHIIVSKKKPSIVACIRNKMFKHDFGIDAYFDHHDYKPLYMIDVKYCPMCGKELKKESDI